VRLPSHYVRSDTDFVSHVTKENVVSYRAAREGAHRDPSNNEHQYASNLTSARDRVIDRFFIDGAAACCER